MDKKNSSLTPTTIVDKNGKITTVHKKPAIAPTHSTIPSVTIAPQQEVFLARFKYSSPSNMKRDYRIIQDYDPTIIPHINKLIDTGTKTGKDMILAYISFKLSDMGDYINSYIDQQVGVESAQRGMVKRFKTTATAAWYLGIMARETKVRVTAARDIENSLAQHWRHHESPNTEATLEDSAYWRGLAVFTLASKDSRLPNDHVEFAHWAGAHTQPERIHNLILKHNTVSVEHLKEIMAQEDVTAPSLIQGIL